ncbi:MAG: hypothetical protein KTR25_16325 [Myxococcales bacterium]|nr:hypothetical protein [Myxococcales bacterium]
MAQKCFRCVGLGSLIAASLLVGWIWLAPTPEGHGPCQEGAAHLIHVLDSPPPERGISLGLFSMESSWSYHGLIDEIVEHGASHVSLVWVWWQQDLHSTYIRPHKEWTATKSQVIDTARYAKSRGLHVTLFPILRLSEPQPGEWRGKISPSNEQLWWENYDAYILEAASVANYTHMDRLLIGSELLTREHMRERWGHLIERIRLRHPQLELMYSANWDHFEPVQFWDLVDIVGLTAYWELGSEHNPSVDNIVKAWRGPLQDISKLSERLQKPVVITEIGYPSLTTGVRWPWDETRQADISLETQRIGYEAFARAASGAQPFLQGVYFWNWFGFGGPEDGNYTPRGKPAADVLRCWFLKTQPPVAVTHGK